MRRATALLAALVAAAAAILLVEATGDSVTIDEFAHLPAGVYYLRTGRFDVFNPSPPLLREIAALPVVAAGPQGDVARFGGQESPQHWALGYEFMNANAERYQRLFVLGRLPMIALTLALVLAVYACGARCFGRGAGLAGAALAAFSPTVLAHGHIVGTDLGCALFVFLAAWAGLEALRAPSRARTVTLGLALGAAQLTKFSAAALYPALAVMALVAVRRGLSPRRAGGVLLAAGALSLAVVNAAYLGHGTGRPLRSYQFASPDLAWLAASPAGIVPVPLPADLVRGYDQQRVEASGVYPAYFHGQWSARGWWWYYPATFLLKETLPLLVLLGLGTVVSWRRRRSLDPLVVAFLVAPPAFFVALLVLLSDLDMGVRYVLPAYPFLFLVAGSVFAPSALSRRGQRLAAALVAAHVAVSAAAAPYHLSYTNALVWPPREAWRWVADSNLDWGQDLQRLGTHLAARGNPHVRLAYFGRAAPELYGIDYEVPAGRLVPGIYVVSASLLAGRPYLLYDHGEVYEAPLNAFAVFRTMQPAAVVGRSLFVYEVAP